MSGLGRVLALIAVAHLAGGQWAVLQGIAWSKMIVDAGRETPLKLVFIETVTGQRTCSLCLEIRDGQRKESEAPQNSETAKRPTTLPFAEDCERVVVTPPGAGRFKRELDRELVIQWVLDPPVPPPRARCS